MFKTRINALTLAMFFAGACSAPAFALDAIDDSDLSDISGQDGITLSFTEPAAGISANTIQWATNATNGLELGQSATPVTLRRLDTTAPMLRADLDVGADGSGNPYVGLTATMARSRLDIGSIGLTGSSGSFGRYVIDSGATFRLQNANGALNATSNWAAATTINVGGVNEALWAPGTLGATTPGQIYWRQGSSELSMGDYTFYFDMPSGRIGVDNNGLLVQSAPGSKIAFALSLDFMYDAAGTSSFAIDASDKSMLYWGWRGHWKDFTLRLNGRGRLDGGGKGLGASLALNYDPDFVWIIGEDGAAPVKLEFGNWTPLPGNTVAFSMPSITLDQLDVGQGATGLCWGLNTISASANGACAGTGAGPVASNFAAQPIKVRSVTDAKALALGVRDMTLTAYSSTVDIVDRTLNPLKAADRYNWALIYTFANLDADIIVTPAATNDRMRLDLALTTQTLVTGATQQELDDNRWRYGTNFMIGDTDVNFGIGLIGADVLMATRNGTLGLTPDGIKFDTSQLRYQLRGMIAGGAIPNMPVMQKMAFVDANLEADRFVLTLSPAPSGQALNYSGFINIVNSNIADFSNPVPTTGNHAGLDDGSYLSLAEPGFNKLGIDFRFANITGPVEVTDGVVDIMGESEGALKLRISNNIRVGTTARVPCAYGVTCTPAAATAPLQVGRLEFGGRDLGTIVMPSGIIRSEISLMPQVP